MNRTSKIKCKEKRPYTNEQQAYGAMKDFQRRNFGGLATNAHTYKCGDHYHWGHYRARKS